MGTSRVASVLLILTAVALGAPGCDAGGGEDGETTTSAPSSTTGAAASPPSEAPMVMMKDFSFEPNGLELGGGAVTIKLVNAGSSPHTFTTDDPKLDFEVAPGKTSEVLARLDDAGEVLFYCRFHRSQGMEGTITVTG